MKILRTIILIVLVLFISGITYAENTMRLYKEISQYGTCIKCVFKYIDKTGKVIIEPQVEIAAPFTEGLAMVGVEIDEKQMWGYIDKTGDMVIKPQQYFMVMPFFDGLAIVWMGNKRGYIDKTGNMVIEPQFENAWPFSEGLAAVEIDKKRGYIDKTGKIIIKPQFDGAGFFF
jgi:hypothetical protein